MITAIKYVPSKLQIAIVSSVVVSSTANIIQARQAWHVLSSKLHEEKVTNSHCVVC